MDKKNLLDKLSTREKQVLDLITTGLSNKEIAKCLFVTEYTVKFHCRNIYSKMQVKNRVELIRIKQN